MMKIIVAFLFYLCLANILVAQNFHFPDSNAIWSVYNEKYFIVGDSLFDAKIYKKILFTTDSIVGNGIIFALFREDTISNQVFAIPSGEFSENLLYDFSLSLNDITTVYPISFSYYYGPVTISIDQIDSILINGQYRKRYFVKGVDQNSNLPEYWIEGIGSTFGILNSGITGVKITDIYYPTLLCFEQEGNLLYQNPDFIDCYEPYPIGIAENESPIIQVFPNPTKNNVKIKSNELIIEYKVFSSHGQLIENNYVKSKEFSMDISDYQQGMYFLYLKQNNGKVVKKITVVR